MSSELLYTSGGTKAVVMPNSSLLRTSRSKNSRHNRGSGMTSSSSATSSNSNNNNSNSNKSNNNTDHERDNNREQENRETQRIRDFEEAKLELKDSMRLNLDKGDEEPPPEPAPPEVPPRGQSLHATSFHRLDHQLKFDKNGDQKHEQFIPSEQKHGKSKCKYYQKYFIVIIFFCLFVCFVPNYLLGFYYE